MPLLRLAPRFRPDLSLTDRRRLRRLLAALALGLATALIVWTLTPRASGTTVIVAAADIAPGTTLAAGDLATRTYPAELVPEGALGSAAAAVGSTAAGHLSRGSPLTAAGLLAPDAGPAEPGRLRMPVTVTDEAAAATLQPGHRVRVFAAGAGGDGADDPDGIPGAAGGATGAVVDEAVVAAVSRTAGTAVSGSTTVVTLDLSEAQAAALAAVSGTALSFALLN